MEVFNNVKENIFLLTISNQQHFSISSVKYIVPIGNQFAEFFESIPCICNIKFITVPPNIKNLRLVCL